MLNNNTNKKLLRKSELAKILNVRPTTIKVYSEMGMLPFIQEGEKLHKRYDPKEVEKRLDEIEFFKQEGFSLEEIVMKLNPYETRK